MTRVLQVLGYAAGGIARHVAHVTAALDGVDGLTVDIAGPGDLPVAMPKDAIDLSIPRGVWGHGPVVRRIAELAGDYDVVHAHGLRAGVDSGRSGRRSDRPAIVTIHNLIRPDISGSLKAALYRPAERAAVRLADRVLAPSRQIADHLRTYLGHGDQERVEVLHVAVGAAAEVRRNRAQVRAELGLDEEDPMVVTVSRLSPQKALHVMIDAIAQLDGVILAIVGSGPLEADLRRHAAERNVAARVRFLGFRDDVGDFVAAADVSCLSSVWEAVPLAAQEAAFLRTPVVATDVGGTGELIEDRVTGRLVPPNDAIALAAALADTLNDRDTAQRYATAAHKRVTTDYSAEAMLARLTEIYRSYE